MFLPYLYLMFSDELKEVTLNAHMGLEKKLVYRIKKISKVEDYVELLRLMYGYYKPLQDKLEPFVSQNNIDNHFTVRSVHNIINDINDLQPGYSDDIPVCETTPDVNTTASSLGALYVTEGSTLGGQIITKIISKQLQISSDKGFSFFNSYGDATPAMWENFKSILNHPREDEERNEMKETAIETFSSFKEWIENNERE